MKKILFSLCSLAMIFVSACNLDLAPTSSISTSEALRSMDDAQKLRRDIYITMRSSLTSGAPVYLLELMADSFHGSITYGNRNGEYYKWEMRSTFGNVESLWESAYYLVMLANFLEEGIPALKETATTAEQAQYDVILGECAFAKAYSMFKLTQLFCKNYSTATATDFGLMLSDKTFTTPSQQATYPGRSTLAETYTYIETNLSKAETLLAGVAGAEGSIYITIDAVKALEARVALTKGEYGKAAGLAAALVDAGKYPLLETQAEFTDLWTNDSGKECITQFWASILSTGNTNDYGYVQYTGGIYAPNYIPEKWIIDAYDAADLRFTTWFRNTPVNLGNFSGTVYLCFKFPGNPELMSSTGTSTYMQKVKPFRIAEQYLIAAEGYAMDNQPVLANNYLNALRAKRIPGWVNQSYSGDELMNQIKKERAREFFGEGFRFTDLKRWNQGMTRSEAQDKNLVIDANSTYTELLSREAGDPFFVWPIPQAEIDANPQIRGQQNPGY
ncbi:MAG: RagB/SusD family nutrient uptake outer membrane protein [Bacteroidales bacterium]|nr:RagB/SusD family nutrient uptake outer membrane protein [Bacteroidales bacterium]